MSKRIALTAAITVLTVGYPPSQEKVNEAELRRIVREEIAKSLRKADPAAPKAATSRVFLPTSVRANRRYTGMPYSLIPTPFGQPRSTVPLAYPISDIFANLFA